MTNQNQPKKSFLDQIMPETEQQFDPEDIESGRATAGLAYIIFFIPLVTASGSQYGKFHANQGLLLLIASIALSIVLRILMAILVHGYFGWGLYSLISMICWAVMAFIGIVGLISGFTGKARELPFIGKIRLIK